MATTSNRYFPSFAIGILVACAPQGDLVDTDYPLADTEVGDTDTDTDADTDSDTDADTDTDTTDTDTTDTDQPCDPANFAPAGPGQFDSRWLGLINNGNNPCPVADQGWSTNKLFPGVGGELGRYCIYEWNPPVDPELCGLPYAGLHPPWDWLERDQLF